MKRRRDPVTSCEDCKMQFQSNESYQRHLSSRSHFKTILAIKNLAMKQCDEFVMDEGNVIWHQMTRMVQPAQVKMKNMIHHIQKTMNFKRMKYQC